MLIDGKRVQAIRELHTISQSRLAKMIGTSASQISLIESNKSGASLKSAIAIARALDTSLDFLTSQVDDPRSASAMVTTLRQQSAELFDQQPGWVAKEKEGWKDYVAIAEVDTAAGTGAVVHDERITGGMKFPVRWLLREGLNAQACRIIRVVGESMEPTLPDGCSILINSQVKRPEHGKVLVIRTGDELIVKRAIRDKEAGWLLTSDNPDKTSWPTLLWPRDGELVGEVRWVWYTLP